MSETGNGSEAHLTDVSGGSADPRVQAAQRLEADYAEARGLADIYDLSGSKMRGWAGNGARILGNGDLLESALLSPDTFVTAEAAVLRATSGPDGILVESLGWEADAVSIRVTVALFEERDRLAAQVIDVVDYALGRVIGTVLGTLLLGSAPVAVALTPPALLWWSLLSPEDRARLQAAGVSAGPELEEWIGDHPELVRHLAAGGGGLLDGLADGVWPGPGGPPFLPAFHPTTESAAAALAGWYDAEGPPQVSDYPLVPPTTTPHTLADLITNLSAINGTDTEPQPDGAVSVQRLTAADGTTRWVAYLPGTDDLATFPWTRDDTVRDLATNFHLLPGHHTTYAEGIKQALTEAGVGDEPVLLVGHSQGGMEAVGLLADDDFDFAGAVTAGAPTSQASLPEGVPVVSLEHRGDVVPLLTGEPNNDTASHVTVRFDDAAGERGDLGAHDLGHYVAGARAADDEGNPQIDEQLAALSGFLDGTTSQTQGYLITR